MTQQAPPKLSPDANRIVYVKRLPDGITNKELYDLFGRHGVVQQIRLGKTTNPTTRGKAYVVYEDVFDAMDAVDQLSGQNIMGQYIQVVFWKPVKKPVDKETSLQEKRQAVANLREKLNR